MKHSYAVPPKRNSHRQWNRTFWRSFNRVRRQVETTLSLLKDHFLLEFHRAKTLSGLAWRVLLHAVALILRRQYALGI